MNTSVIISGSHGDIPWRQREWRMMHGKLCEAAVWNCSRYSTLRRQATPGDLKVCDPPSHCR
jgi:hypothetical protein